MVRRSASITLLFNCSVMQLVGGEVWSALIFLNVFPLFSIISPLMDNISITVISDVL